MEVQERFLTEISLVTITPGITIIRDFDFLIVD